MTYIVCLVFVTGLLNYCRLVYHSLRGYRGGSPTAVQA